MEGPGAGGWMGFKKHENIPFIFTIIISMITFIYIVSNFIYKVIMGILFKTHVLINRFLILLMIINNDLIIIIDIYCCHAHKCQ